MADILVRMEMPKHCFNCSTKIDPDNRQCNIDGHVFEETLSKLTCRRDEHCPLHELPEHKDLIDRSEAIKSIEWKWAGKAAFEALEQVPAVIPSNKEESE